MTYGSDIRSLLVKAAAWDEHPAREHPDVFAELEALPVLAQLLLFLTRFPHLKAGDQFVVERQILRMELLDQSELEKLLETQKKGYGKSGRVTTLSEMTVEEGQRTPIMVRDRYSDLRCCRINNRLRVQRIAARLRADSHTAVRCRAQSLLVDEDWPLGLAR